MLRKLRKRRRLSLRLLASLSGLSHTHIGAVERGETTLTAPALVRLARGLNMRPGELLERMYGDGKADGS